MKPHKFILSSLAVVISFLLLSIGVAAAAPSVKPLPSGWEEKGSTASLQTGALPALQAHFELHSQQISPGNMPLEQWAILAKKLEAQDSAITNRVETDLKPKKIGEHETLVYEVTGELFGSPLHYEIFLLKVGDYFCKISCWTTPKQWDAAQGKFEELIGSVN